MRIFCVILLTTFSILIWAEGSAHAAMATPCDLDPYEPDCPPPSGGGGGGYVPPPPPPIASFAPPVGGAATVTPPTLPAGESCKVISVGYSNLNGNVSQTQGPTMRIMGCIYCVGSSCQDETYLSGSAYVGSNGVPIGTPGSSVDDFWPNSPRPEPDGTSCGCIGNYYIDSYSVCSSRCKQNPVGVIGPAATVAELGALGTNVQGSVTQMAAVCWGRLPSGTMYHPVLGSNVPGHNLSLAVVKVVPRSVGNCGSGFRGGWHPLSYALHYIYGCTPTADPNRVCVIEAASGAIAYQSCLPASGSSPGGGTYLIDQMNCQ